MVDKDIVRMLDRWYKDYVSNAKMYGKIVSFESFEEVHEIEETCLNDVEFAAGYAKWKKLQSF